MEVQILEDGYTRHGCNIRSLNGETIAMIEYSGHVTNHEFLGAYKSGGLFDYLDKAKKVMAEQYPGAIVVLTAPDLVFRIPARR